jgi:hypothetical protein
MSLMARVRRLPSSGHPFRLKLRAVEIDLQLTTPIPWILLLSLPLAACSSAHHPSASEGPKYRISERVLSDDDLLLQEIDLDADGTPETLNYYRVRKDTVRLLVRKEIDLNRDGRVDVVSYFDPEGQLEKEEMDSDYDGQFDWTDHYQDGVRVMSEWDSDYDGRPNIYKYYIRDESGRVFLDRKERDSNGDGQIDVWERFSPTGEVIRFGRDTDGDGEIDVRDE